MIEARRQADAQVAEAVHTAERQIEAALVSTANLILVMSQARKAAKLSLEFGHNAFVQAGTTTQTLIAARGEILATHKELADVRRQMGVLAGDPLVDFGGDLKPPQSASVEAAPLRVVRAA